MRQPRPEHFQPNYKLRRAEEIDLSNVMPLKSSQSAKREIYPDKYSSRTVEPNGRTERLNHTTEATDEIERTNRTVEPNGRTALSELDDGIPDENTRKTQRYSFEIYMDQKYGIEELQMLYRQRTGRKLSASRIIREAIDEYLSQAAKKTP